jgi:rhamnose utilization protein RhaD (predicted bifunctional aldolase and dehydrogenase)
MSTASNCIEKQVKAFCAQIGADPLLVHGAGGNVSWKDGDVLWVKASGMWLVDAQLKDIFVPVNLAHLHDALAKRDFSVKPEVHSNSGLRPSIETLLHALMPQKVVVHLHAVEILAHLVQVTARQRIKSLVADSVEWIYIDYFKPGADLARAVSEKLTTRPDANVVFMGNHGAVIGGRSVDDVVATLHTLTSKLKAQRLLSVPETSPVTRQSDFFARGYIPCADKEVGLLARRDDLINRLRHEWALYPDHVVFLGAKPAIFEAKSSQLDLDEIVRNKPPFIFSCRDGVYENPVVTPAQKCQLRCYFDVVSRLGGEEKLSTLSDLQVSELLDWDAEKYRKDLIYYK